jgi:hypothetical protein
MFRVSFIFERFHALRDMLRGAHGKKIARVLEKSRKRPVILRERQAIQA